MMMYRNKLTHSYLVVVASLSALSFNTLAEDPKFYGRMDLGISYSEAGTTTQNGKSGTVLENNFSRLGVKGSSKLSEDLKLLYKVEVQVNSMTDADEVFSPRNTYLGCLLYTSPSPRDS